MSMEVGLTEYLGKGPADIFLCVMYPKVVLIYGEIFKADIIICALLRVLYRWIFYLVVYNAIIETLFVLKRQIKKVNLSAFGRYRCKIKANG